MDRFLRSRSALWIAFAWGFAEATFFFLVPDVWLTLLACRSLRSALRGTVAALCGALIGGALMYALGRMAPDAGRYLLDCVPGINQPLLASAQSQIDNRGLLAVMVGPLLGIPYKIYAVDWGARAGSLLGFLLVSIPARCARFLATALAASALARLLVPWTSRRIVTELSLYALCWIVFYSFYFRKFGW